MTHLEEQMIKTNRAINIMLTALTIIFLFLIGCFNIATTVFADTKYFSAEQYTEDDGLLLSDGTSSSLKDINDFATEVKSASIGTEFPELSQVIPLQYLESIEENAAELLKGQPYRSIHQNWVLTYSNSHSMID